MIHLIGSKGRALCGRKILRLSTTASSVVATCGPCRHRWRRNVHEQAGLVERRRERGACADEPGEEGTRYEVVLRSRTETKPRPAAETDSYRAALEAVRALVDFAGACGADVVVHDRSEGKDVAGYRNGKFWEIAEL